MELLISKDQIRARVIELAAEISTKYVGKPLILIGILRGCAPFLVDLMREISPRVDLEIDFMSVGSYGAAQKTSGVVTIFKDITSNVEGKHVILVDDIVDTGRTIAKLREMFVDRGLSVECACLLSKPSRREVNVPVQYIGFEIKNKYVVGYGLDNAQKFRNLPEIYTLE